ncbi:hypothetical protein [Mesorhizobium sp. A623]
MTAPDLPIGGTTGLCHETSATIDAAAVWLVAADRTGQAIVPELRQRFGLTTMEAIEAIREANRQRAATSFLTGTRLGGTA